MRLPDHWFYGRRAGAGESFRFDAEETAHATRALRLSAGDTIQWIDGSGQRFAGEIAEVSRQGMTAFAKTAHAEPAPEPLSLAVGALHDATRLEWLVEKATELGATEFVLLATRRVQRSRYRMSRLHAKAVAAMKQSGRAWLPTIAERTWGEQLAREGGAHECGELRLVAHCDDGQPREPLQQVLAKAPQPYTAVTIAIGPEGDFDPEEVAAALASGYLPVSLGGARLRTETAALFALAVVQADRDARH